MHHFIGSFALFGMMLLFLFIAFPALSQTRIKIVYPFDVGAGRSHRFVPFKTALMANAAKRPIRLKSQMGKKTAVILRRFRLPDGIKPQHILAVNFVLLLSLFYRSEGSVPAVHHAADTVLIRMRARFAEHAVFLILTAVMLPFIPAMKERVPFIAPFPSVAVVQHCQRRNRL